jgi:hypothetical protein
MPTREKQDYQDDEPNNQGQSGERYCEHNEPAADRHWIQQATRSRGQELCMDESSLHRAGSRRPKRTARPTAGSAAERRQTAVSVLAPRSSFVLAFNPRDKFAFAASRPSGRSRVCYARATPSFWTSASWGMGWSGTLEPSRVHVPQPSRKRERKRRSV